VQLLSPFSPLWYGLAALVSLGIATLFYYLKPQKSYPNPWIQRGLFLLKSLSTFLLLLLIINPILRRNNRVVQKPIIGILVDQSQSVALQPLGKTYTQEIPEKIKKIKEKLDGQFDVKTFSFSSQIVDSLQPRWGGNASNLGKALEQFQEKFEGQNVGALLVATDGIVNQGKNPWYVAQQLNFPIYPLALGDTTPQIDLAIQSIKHNEVVMKGNEFQAIFNLSAKALPGKTAFYTLQKIGKNNQISTVKTGNFPVQKNDFQTAIPVQLLANEAGLQHYRLTLTPISGEKNTQNNTKDFFVEVIDDRARILLLASAPHPDVATVRQILSQKQSMEVVVKNPEAGNIGLSNFDAVICFQLPSINGNDQIVQQIRQSQLPVWYIGGNQTAYSRLNALQGLMTIRPAGKSLSNEITPIQNTSFSLFGLSEKCSQRIKSFPPLQVPYGDYAANGNASALFLQQIKSVPTSMPLFAFGEQQGIRQVILVGEGLWKWYLDEYEQFGEHFAVDECISKTVQYLALKQNKKIFRAKSDRLIYEEGEEVLFSAELFNKNYEPVNEPDVQLTISNAKGKTFSFSLGKTDQKYLGNVGKWPEGKYQYEAKTTYQGTAYSEKGEFSVQGNTLEAAMTQANWSLLRNLAAPQKGNLYPYENWENVVDDLSKRPDLKPVSYLELLLTEILDVPWLLVLMLSLWSAEWLWRKWLGHA
jgi:hypothetical protein